MGSIIVASPKLENAKKISETLKSHGAQRIEVCTTGAAILEAVHQLDSGIVICTRSFKDMYCAEILASLPEYFTMLLITSEEGIEQCPDGVEFITMPFKVSELLGAVNKLTLELEQRIRRERSAKPKKRNREEQEWIDKAKAVLMEKKDMTEPEAFRYIQKCSMDNCTNMVETAQMILTLYAD